MTIESIPKFTPPAAILWASLPEQARKLYLSNVWCGKCRHEVTITNFSGTVKRTAGPVQAPTAAFHPSATFQAIFPPALKGTSTSSPNGMDSGTIHSSFERVIFLSFLGRP